MNLAALFFVVGLIGFLAWAAQRFGLGGMMPTKRGRRLGVVETLSLDARRRLVLVRRDEVEHLLLIGPGGDRPIETGIRREAQSQAPPP
ncbi:MAG: hypothetical protein FJX46_17950 [Alphaproteobacteria bacterium]|nr:hypothetical protein [Alphaproteobacteria bacterium]